MRNRKKNTIYILLVTGVFVLLNFISDQYFFRLDFTGDQRYTLSRATKNIVRNLEEPVTVTAYFSGNLPVQLEQVKKDFRDMLVEYSNRSKGVIAYEFVDPLKSPEIKAQASRIGIPELRVQVEEKDQVKAQIAYFGAHIQMGENSEVIPAVTSVNGLEYQLTSTIKKLSVVDKPVVGFVQGHGEATFGKIWDVKQALDVLHQTELVNLSDSLLNLERYRTLAIINPADSFPTEELMKLDQFVSRGGRLFIAMNRSNADLTRYQYSYAVNTGLENWLSAKGININSNAVIDMNCQQFYIQPQPNYIIPVSIPYYVIAVNFQDHPVSSGLEQVYLSFVSSISFAGDSALRFTPLVKSSENAGTSPAEEYIDITKEWDKRDFTLSGLTLAAAVEGRFQGGLPTKMVLIGDGDLISHEDRQQVNPDNIHLVVNSIDWLSDDTGLVELRTKGATARPLKELEESKRTFLKFLNFLLPIILALIYGIFRFQQNRIKRYKRMEAGYVQ